MLRKIYTGGVAEINGTPFLQTVLQQRQEQQLAGHAYVLIWSEALKISSVYGRLKYNKENNIIESTQHIETLLVLRLTSC